MITCVELNEKNICIKQISATDLYSQFPNYLDRRSMIYPPTMLWGNLVIYSEEGYLDGLYKNKLCNHLTKEDDYYYGKCLIFREDKNGYIQSLRKCDITKIVKRCYEAIL